jgi:5-formyltetrahydrofolate cyclo-ligase
MTKEQWRKIVRHKCQLLEPSYQLQAAKLAKSHCLAQFFFKHFQHFACYLAQQHELDTEPLIKALWQAGKQCYLPRIDPQIPQAMHFVPYAINTPLVANRYGILEPSTEVSAVPITRLEVVLVPLLAFNAHGQRLGAGGGYYDKTFASQKISPASPPLLIGYAYACQEIADIPIESWDIGLNGIITENGYRQFI